MIRVNQISLPLKHDQADLKKALASKLRLSQEEILSFKILRQSVDARKGKISFSYSVAASLKNEKKVLKKAQKDISPYTPVIYRFPYENHQAVQDRPCIVGSGPAGLFCALMLARAGFKPLLFERGSEIHKRVEIVSRFWQDGSFDPACNVQFGEGGAGTFSDGKLNTLNKDHTGRHTRVLQEFVNAGAPEDILYVQKPHIGTDLLVEVIAQIRQEIISLGGEVRFDSCVTDIREENWHLTGLVINHEEVISCSHAVFAVGHSARDTYRMLFDHHMRISQKPFAMGVRVEHPQEMISRIQYGEAFKDLPPASYKLTAHTANGRSVYTFCMCPGGYVVNASSEAGGLVVNGMSYRKRDSANANSAVLVNVTPEDFGSPHPLAGVEFQRKWEQLAWQTGGGRVPVQLFEDFLKGRPSDHLGDVQPIHKGDWTFAELPSCLPAFVADSLAEGMAIFGRKIRGFDRPDTLMSGIETRSSAPIRMDRDEALESSIKGIYPCGEGAGYAGGITSAAIDGIRAAEAVAAHMTGA